MLYLPSHFSYRSYGSYRSNRSNPQYPAKPTATMSIPCAYGPPTYFCTLLVHAR